MMRPDLGLRAAAAAGALVQLALVLAALAACRLLGGGGHGASGARRGGDAGRRGAGADTTMRPRGGHRGARWWWAWWAAEWRGWRCGRSPGCGRFPDAVPRDADDEDMGRGRAPDLLAAAGVTLGMALAATGAALVLVLGCLEAEARFGLRPGDGRCGCCGCR